jgi:hypothetical protein
MEHVGLLEVRHDRPGRRFLGGRVMRKQEFIEPPFRIMPSRPRNGYGPLALISIGAVLFGVGIWDAADGPPDSFGTALMLIGGLALVAICTFWFFRERRYFDPRNEYWIAIGVDDFALVTPDATDRTAWSNLSPFEVEETTVKRKTKYGEYESTSYATVAKYGGLQIKIPLRDFATNLAPTEMSRAHAMCAVLNELRASALGRQVDRATIPFHVPPGLVVAPMPKPTKVPHVLRNSVVQRS